MIAIIHSLFNFEKNPVSISVWTVDFLWMRKDSSDERKTIKESFGMLDNIWVSQHDGDYTDRPLRATLIANGGITSGKMRLMRPKATTFAS